MRKHFMNTHIADLLIIGAMVITATGCGGIATLPLDSTQPVVDQTEATIDGT